MVATTGGDTTSVLASATTLDATTIATVAGPLAVLDERIVAATLICVARQGIAATTLDDVAHEAGCSRATIYRCFPGGWDVLLAAAAQREIAAQVAILADRVATAPDLEGLLVMALTTLSSHLRHHAVLRPLLEHESGYVRPHLAFDGLDPLLARAVELGGAWLEPYVDPVVARATVEWVVRLVLSYCDEPLGSTDLTDPDAARHLVRTFVLPALVSDPA